jgi:hypothetical protein
MRSAIGSPDAVLGPFFHVGIVVPDLEAAMEELGAAMGFEWSGPLERDLGKWVVRAAFARTSPPYVELIQSIPGSVWETAPGAPFHHLSYWCDELESTSSALAETGMALELDLGFARYHLTASGTRIELLDADIRAAFDERWGLPG